MEEFSKNFVYKLIGKTSGEFSLGTFAEILGITGVIVSAETAGRILGVSSEGILGEIQQEFSNDLLV